VAEQAGVHRLSAGRGSRLRVALAQVDCALGDVQENVRRARAVIDEARDLAADLVVFPELSLTGYAVGTVSDDVAIPPDDPAILALGEAAAGMGVVVGFVEDGPVHTHNSAAYLEGGSIVRVQRKAYLPTYGRFEEHKHFTAGPSLRAFDTGWGRAALLICNDAWQPPLPFLAVHDGARTLIVPACSALAADSGDPAEIERDWNDLLRFHARFLQTHVVFVNRVGTEAGVTFWGGSQVLDPWGRVIAQAPRGEPAVTLAELDLDAVRRRRREMPLVKEPRLELLRRELDRLADAGG
jgi:predicted amidohydrolase